MVLRSSTIANTRAYCPTATALDALHGARKDWFSLFRVLEK